MSQAHKLVFFCPPERREQYLTPYAAALSSESRWQIVWEDRQELECIKRHADSAALLWLDSFDASVIEASNLMTPGQARIACRLDSNSLFHTDPGRCRWEFFDHLVAPDQLTFEILLSRLDRLESFCKLHTIPPAVNPGLDAAKRKVQTKNIAYVGALSSQLNSHLLVQALQAIVKWDPEFKLYIVGQFADLATRVYFEHLLGRMGLGKNISFQVTPEDWQVWFKDKSFFLSTATQPGQETNVASAMAAGLRPLVHNYYGADQFYSEESLFDSILDLPDMVAADMKPSEYRRQAIAKFGLETNLPGLIGLLKEATADPGQPRVSIIVPTYNRAELLHRTLGDLTQQTYPNLEIVVSDDCSTDNTAEVAAECRQQHENIVYTRNERNLGPCLNAGKGVEQASGDYVIFCSDDDLLDPEAISQYVDLALRKDADVVYADLSVLDGDGNQRTIWKYRNYYDNFDLLRDLIGAGCNRIPEAFLCRRELFEQIYVETYGKRFLNTFFLPSLRRTRMIHLPKPLYRYTVHEQSTFNSVRGLYDRVKSTQNYINTALFMYSPIDIFQIDQHLKPSDQIAMAYYSAAAVIAKLGTGFIEGKFYTGIQFNRNDRLFKAYFYNAYHWLEQARKYGLPEAEYRQLYKALATAGDPLDFDAVTTVNVPDVYRRLPWFAFRPFNTASTFVALDICTLGGPEWFERPQFRIHEDEQITVSVKNHRPQDDSEFDQIISGNPVTVINVFDAQQLEATIQYLIDHHLFSVQLLNFTEVEIPELDLLRNVHNLADAHCSSFDEYLDLLTQITAVRHESTPVSTPA